jgi:hypothetical protein
MSTVRDLINNEELVNQLVEDITEIPEDSEVTYEVWAIGYDHENIFATEMLIGEFTNPDKAVECATQLTLADIIQQAAREDFELEPIADTSHISIEVETVVEEGNSSMNVGTIYKRDLWIDSSAEEACIEDTTPVVALTGNDFTLLKDGTLKISCKLLKDFNKNDYVIFEFPEEDIPTTLTYKIVSKVIYEDGNYYHCEVIL